MIRYDDRSRGDKLYRMRSRIQAETMIVIPANWLNCERKRTEMTLVDNGSNQLQKRLGGH